MNLSFVQLIPEEQEVSIMARFTKLPSFSW